MDTHDRYAHQILTQIEAVEAISQRSLASHLGIALGLTNFLVRRVVKRGWVKVIRIRPNRVRYLLTPEGLAEKARMSRLFLQDSLKFYSSARDRIHASLATAGLGASSADSPRRVVFYGAGEVAEIAYICLQETNLQLVGVVDDSGRRQFLGLPVYPSETVRDGRLQGLPFDRLVITQFGDREDTERQLASLGVPSGRICWL